MVTVRESCFVLVYLASILIFVVEIFGKTPDQTDVYRDVDVVVAFFLGVLAVDVGGKSADPRFLLDPRIRDFGYGFCGFWWCGVFYVNEGLKSWQRTDNGAQK